MTSYFWQYGIDDHCWKFILCSGIRRTICLGWTLQPRSARSSKAFIGGLAFELSWPYEVKFRRVDYRHQIQHGPHNWNAHCPSTDRCIIVVASLSFSKYTGVPIFSPCKCYFLGLSRSKGNFVCTLGSTCLLPLVDSVAFGAARIVIFTTRSSELIHKSFRV